MGVEFESTPMGEPLWESLELCVDGQAGVWWAQPAGARMCMSTSACTANLLQPARAHACDPDLLWRRTCLGLRVRRMCVCCKVAEVCVRGFVGSCVRDCVRASACACLRACLSANKGGALSSAQRAARASRGKPAAGRVREHGGRALTLRRRAASHPHCDPVIWQA